MRKFLNNLRDYPTKAIVVLLGAHLVVLSLYALMPFGPVPEGSTLSFGLGGTTFYLIYLAVCMLVGLGLILGASFGRLRVERTSLLLYVAIRLYIVTVTIITIGVLPSTIWLSSLILAAIAMVIRISLRLRDDSDD